MLYAVANESYKLGVDIQDRKEAISLIHQDGRCYGAVVRDLVTGELSAYVSKALSLLLVDMVECIAILQMP